MQPIMKLRRIVKRYPIEVLLAALLLLLTMVGVVLLVNSPPEPPPEIWEVLRVGSPTSYGLLWKDIKCTVQLGRIGDGRQVIISTTGSRCNFIRVGDMVSTRWPVGNGYVGENGAVNFSGF